MRRAGVHSSVVPAEILDYKYYPGQKKKRPLRLCIKSEHCSYHGISKIKLDCASVCSDARSRGQPRHRANLLIMLIVRDQNSVLVAVFMGQGSS